MISSITAPPATNSINFTGYDGTAIDICDKMTSLMALHEKWRMLLDTFVNPETMKYTMEAIYPGLLPPGTIAPYNSGNTDLAAVRREVWMLQRTQEDIAGMENDDDKLKVGAIWNLCDGGYAGGSASPDLQGRFIIGAGAASGNRTAKDVRDSGGSEKVILTKEELPQHNHGPVRLGNTQANDVGDVAPMDNPAYALVGPDKAERTKGNCEIIGATSGLGPTLAENEEGGLGHDNMPPWYAVVYMVRTLRVDSTYISA